MSSQILFFTKVSHYRIEFPCLRLSTYFSTTFNSVIEFRAISILENKRNNKKKRNKKKHSKSGAGWLPDAYVLQYVFFSFFNL